MILIEMRNAILIHFVNMSYHIVSHHIDADINGGTSVIYNPCFSICIVWDIFHGCCVHNYTATRPPKAAYYKSYHKLYLTEYRLVTYSSYSFSYVKCMRYLQRRRIGLKNFPSPHKMKSIQSTLMPIRPKRTRSDIVYSRPYGWVKGRLSLALDI